MTLESYTFDLLGRRCHVDLPKALIPWLRYEYDFGYAIPNSHNDITITALDTRFSEPTSAKQNVSIPGQEIDAFPYTVQGEDGFLLRVHSSALFVPNTLSTLYYHSDESLRGLPALIGIGLNELLRRSGWLPFHASVAVKNNVAVNDTQVLAFLGPSGRGKSTTLLTALQNGYQALNEDSCWLAPDSNLIYGWDRGFHLLADSYERFAPMLQDIPYTEIKVLSGDKKRLLWRDLLERNLVTTSPVELTHLVWLERPSDFLKYPSAWQSISKHHAALGMWEAIGTTLNSHTGQGIANRIPQLLKSLECRQLFLGNTPIPFGDIDT